jgi:hypothetical protein
MGNLFLISENYFAQPLDVKIKIGIAMTIFVIPFPRFHDAVSLR